MRGSSSIKEGDERKREGKEVKKTRMFVHMTTSKLFYFHHWEEKLHTDIAFIYLSGMQKAISEFFRKYLFELRNSFVEILKICHRLGMTQL